jgi:Arc/MetJ family transcription regulator
MPKTLIDIDKEMLARASAALGTSTNKDTVNQALALAAAASPEIRRAALAKLGQLSSRLDLDLIDLHEEADHQ